MTRLLSPDDAEFAALYVYFDAPTDECELTPSQIHHDLSRMRQAVLLQPLDSEDVTSASLVVSLMVHLHSNLLSRYHLDKTEHLSKKRQGTDLQASKTVP